MALLPKSRLTSDLTGFSLIETLVATLILASALAALAQLFVVSVSTNASARKTSIATLLAQQKIEQLRGLAYGVDSGGTPFTDVETDTTRVPEDPGGGTGLTPSPDRSLFSNMPGYCDFADPYGRVIPGSGPAVPGGAAYIRRWSIQPLPTDPNNAIVIQVLVTPRRNRGTADAGLPGGVRLPDEARMVTVRTRRAS